MTSNQILDERYGRKKSKQRDRRIGVFVAGALAIAGFTWIISVAFFAPAKATGEITSFSPTTSQLVHVKGFIQKPASSHATCAVAVRNGNLSVVGYLNVEAPKGQATTNFELDIRVTEAAESAVAQDCRVD
ncbi:MAG: hypothetical protein RL556_491 [Actinomycetota bacterium]|jgi:hypothetical protein